MFFVHRIWDGDGEPQGYGGEGGLPNGSGVFYGVTNRERWSVCNIVNALNATNCTL